MSPRDGARGERTGLVADTRSQDRRSTLCACRWNLRGEHFCDEEEQRAAGGNGRDGKLSHHPWDDEADDQDSARGLESSGWYDEDFGDKRRRGNTNCDTPFRRKQIGRMRCRSSDPLITRIRDVGDLELEELENVDTKSVQNHCKVGITVFDKHGHQPWSVRGVLERGAGILCVSGKMAAELGTHFGGT